MTERVDKAAMACNKPRRTPGHPEKSHIVKACYDGKEKIIRFGEQGKKVGTVSGTAGKPKAGESDRMKAKRKSFKARHAKNIAKGPSSAAYWANKVKWADGGHVELSKMLADYEGADDLHHLVQKFKTGGQPKKDKEPGLMDYLKSVANTVTSLPEAPAAIYNAGKEFVQAIPRAARTAAGYINNTPLTKVGQDVRRGASTVAGGLNTIARQARQNPVNTAKTVASTALDVIPVIGDIKAYGQDVSTAARMRARGDVRGAQNIERMALPLAIASIAPGVGEARKAGKVARIAEEAADAADDIKQLTRRLTANPERSVSSGATRVGESTPGNMLDFMLGHGAVTEPVVERLPPFPKPKQLGPRHYSNQDLAELGLNMENAKLNFAKEMAEQEGIPLEEALKMAQEEAIVEDWSSVLPRTSDVDTWSGKLLYRGIPRVGENNLTTLSGLHAKERGMTDLPGHVAANTGNYAWASDNPRLAETYTHQGGVMVPLRLVREPDLVFDAQNQMWSDFFYPGQQWYDSSSPVNVDPIFEKAMKDPDVKSILVKNVIDPGSETNKSQFLNRWARETHGVDWKDLTDDQKSDLYGSSGLMANNVLIKDPSVVEYALTKKVPEFADGGLVSTYDEAKVNDLADQIREGIYG